MPAPSNFTRPDDVVLDPFAGSGTTLVAAKQCGREAIGIEINHEYADKARERLEAMPVMLPFAANSPGLANPRRGVRT